MIEFKNVSLSTKKEKVMSGFNFKLHKGTLGVIDGPLGSGKSLLVQSLISPKKNRALVAVDYHGSITIDGFELNELDDDQKRQFLISSGIALQQPAVVDSATVMKHLMMPDVKKSEVEVMLKFLALDQYQNSKVRELSYGQKRVLDLGRSLMMHPSLVVWDEPFAGVDTSTVKRMVNYLLELTKEGKTVLILTSDEWLVDYLKKKTAKVEHLVHS
jgi:ABC-type multidrug transport system ATPase subunit